MNKAPSQIPPYPRPYPRPRSTTPNPCMTKEEFMVAYVLHRAAVAPSGLSGDAAAKEAAYAWDVIQSRKDR